MGLDINEIAKQLNQALRKPQVEERVVPSHSLYRSECSLSNLVFGPSITFTGIGMNNETSRDNFRSTPLTDRHGLTDFDPDAPESTLNHARNRMHRSLNDAPHGEVTKREFRRSLRGS